MELFSFDESVLVLVEEVYELSKSVLLIELNAVFVLVVGKYLSLNGEISH